MKSTPIMTELRRKNEILLIEMDTLNIQDIIIVYDIPKKYEHYARGYDTVTGFKKWGKYEILKFAQKRQQHIICTQSLNGVPANIWQTPFQLGGVTEFDKDFRKEWNGDYLEYEGNEYGDTSKFYIIGTTLHK